MAFAGPSRGVKNDINVTPLVDVVLVLLIIFMVVTPMLQRGKELKLPKAAVHDENKKPDALIISVPPDRSIWIESHPMTADSLRELVAASMHADPNRKILIKADQTLKVKDVRKVVAEAQAAGARGISLAVEEVQH